jgi:hypothetical protein
MRTLVLLLLLVLPAQATTYSFPTNHSISVYVSGDIPDQTGVQYFLSPSPFAVLPDAGDCPANTSCTIGLSGGALVSNSIPVNGNMFFNVSLTAFGGVLGCYTNSACRTLYVPGGFALDDSSRLLTISSQIFFDNHGFLYSIPDTFITFDLPDGLTLGEPPLAFALEAAETPLPAAWPLFASGLALLLWRRRRQ